MKKLTIAFAAIFIFGAVLAVCSGKKQENNDVKEVAKQQGSVLVAYFSATGTTENVAKMIATATDGELYEIKPQEKYTAEDLDWTKKTSRSSRENAEPQSRPAFVKDKANLDAYDVIYLGYPNWWNKAPRIINTFVEAYGLKNKKVIPFMTSGGDDIINSVDSLRNAYPDVDWQEGRVLNQVEQKDVDEWVK